MNTQAVWRTNVVSLWYLQIMFLKLWQSLLWRCTFRPKASPPPSRLGKNGCVTCCSSTHGSWPLDRELQNPGRWCGSDWRWRALARDACHPVYGWRRLSGWWPREDLCHTQGGCWCPEDRRECVWVAEVLLWSWRPPGRSVPRSVGPPRWSGCWWPAFVLAAAQGFQTPPPAP